MTRFLEPKILKTVASTKLILFCFDLANENIQLVPGCQLTYHLQTHKALESVMHLMPENVFFASDYCLAGMVPASAKSGQGNRHKPKNYINSA